MNGLTFGNGLALWGALLSTLLAALKIWETWSARRRIVLSSYLSTDPGGDHRLQLTNLSGSPILLRTWAIVPTRKFLVWRVAEGRLLYVSGRSGAAEIVAPHGQFEITIGASWHLEWQTAEALKRPPYLQLFVEGRERPLLVRIVSAKQRQAALRNLRHNGQTTSA